MPKIFRPFGAPTLFVFAATAVIGVTGCAKPNSDPAPAPEAAAALDSDGAKASYTVGYGTSDEFRSRMGEDFDADAFLAGARDALTDAMPQVSQEDGRVSLGVLGDKARAAASEAAEANKATGAAFLEENGAREGVVTLDSGLQYMVLNEGSGESPGPTATVETHYEGRLIDGTVFDSSIARGEPASFPVNRVIAGWTEALQLMKTGSKWRLFIPSDLAYGGRATGNIPPHSTLIFEVELLSIKG